MSQIHFEEKEIKEQLSQLNELMERSVRGSLHLSKELSEMKEKMKGLLEDKKRNVKPFKHVKSSKSGGSILHVEDSLDWFEENKGGEEEFKGGLVIGITEMDGKNKTRVDVDKEGTERKKFMTARLDRDEVYQMYHALMNGSTSRLLGYTKDLEEEIAMIEDYISQLEKEEQRVDIQTKLLLKNKKEELNSMNPMVQKFGFQSYGRRREKEAKKEYSITLNVKYKDQNNIEVHITERPGYVSSSGATLPVKNSEVNFQVMKKFTMEEYTLWVMNMYNYLETVSLMGMLKGKPLYTLMKATDEPKEVQEEEKPALTTKTTKTKKETKEPKIEKETLPTPEVKKEEVVTVEKQPVEQKTIETKPMETKETVVLETKPIIEKPVEDDISQYENYIISNITSLKGKKMGEIDPVNLKKIVVATKDKKGFEEVHTAAFKVLTKKTVQEAS